MYKKVLWILQTARIENNEFKKKNEIIHKRAAGIIWKCYISKENIEDQYLKDKKYRKARDHCHYSGKYRGAAHSTGNLKYSVPKKISIVFHNAPNDDYHFIIKDLAEEFKKQFTCLGENEKYITSTVPTEKENTRSDKNGEEITKHISSILQFMDSARFMASSIPDFVNNLSKGIHKTKCDYRHDNKKSETCRSKYNIATVSLNTQALNLI